MRAEPLIGLEPDTQVAVSAPASSANLGPGFDCFGLALDWRDELVVSVAEHGYAAVVTGEGAATLASDEAHLVIRCVRAALDALGASAPGLKVRSHNTIPHGRGLGSSSAAIVGGLTAGWALARPGQPLDRDWALRLATRIEGHPDNVAAAVVGGFTLAYRDRQDQVQAASVPVHPGVVARVLVSDTALSTVRARGLLPRSVSHSAAAANAGRAALLVHALRAAPELLTEATEDWLHQDSRAPAMPASAGLCSKLREEGLAAVISGAGPSVLVLGRPADLARLDDREVPGFAQYAVRIGVGACIGSGSAT